MGPGLLADEVSITLLLVGQSIEVLLDLQSDNAGRRVSEIVFQIVGVHFGGCCEESGSKMLLVLVFPGGW